MKIPATAVALLALAACVQVNEREPDSARAKIDTSSGLLATAAGPVDSTPTSVVPRTPPPIGADSVTYIRGLGSAGLRQALRNDSAIALTVPDSEVVLIPPVAAPPAPPPVGAAGGSDLEQLRRTMQVPVSGIAASALHDSFDERRGGGRRHDAMDIAAPRGTPVVSATGGRVLRLFDSKAGGLMVYATDSSQRFILMYGHLDAYHPGLAAGQPLRRGQPIGTVGTTGNAPVNVPHLHFVVARTTNVNEWWKGAPVNPYLLLKP